MRAIICDICGKVMPYNNAYTTYGFVRIRTDRLSDPDDAEVCIECIDKIQDFIKSITIENKEDIFNDSTGKTAEG